MGHCNLYCTLLAQRFLKLPPKIITLPAASVEINQKPRPVANKFENIFIT